MQALPYPGFATDLQAPMAVLLTQAHGVSYVHERVFDNRLLYISELRKMGAEIVTTGTTVAIISGPTPLTGASLRALDVRAGAAFILAGLVARGRTEVTDIYHVDRGYERIDEKLRALGADIERSLMVFGKRIGVDLGTANVLVYVKGRGIVINEPAVVAVAHARQQHRRRRHARRATCSAARRARSRSSGPMREGVIADYVTTEAMLRYFIGKVIGRVSLVRPEVMICVPAGVTGVEQRAVQDAAEAAGARRPAHLIPEPLAAAIGARIPVNMPQGHMIVDIGGGRTEAAVISMYGIVVSESVRVAGDRLDDAIAAYVKRRHNLVDRRPHGGGAEDRHRLGHAAGRRDDLPGPRPRPDHRPAAHDHRVLDRRHQRHPGPAQAIVGAVRAVLERTPPELASDVVDRGVVLSGGTAMLRNLDRLITRRDRHPLLRRGQPDGVRGDGRRHRPRPPGPDQALDARRGRVAGLALSGAALSSG